MPTSDTPPSTASADRRRRGAARLVDASTFRVLWHDDADPPVLEPERALPAEVDVVVIGAGYCGLAAARELAARGRRVLVLEREPLGFGASTRNGGMVIPELHASPAELRHRYGPLGDAMWASVNEAFDWVEDLIERDGLDCAYERTGMLLVAHAPHAAESLRRLAGELRAEGEEADVVEGAALAAEVGSAVHETGVLVARTGGLQPARFHAGLARLALGAGAEVHDRTAVVTVDRRPGQGWRVYTNRARVECRQLLLAANATIDGTFGDLRRRVVPIGSYIVATEPLEPALAAEISPRGRMLVDTKNFLFYWRLSPDGRVVFGGRKSLLPPSPEAARDHLAAGLARIHPQLDGVRLTHSWGGYVAVTVDRLPHCGVRDDLWYATGCNGSGVATMPWLGAQVAAAMTGDGPLPPFAELDHRPVPLWRLRRLTLPVAGAWFGAQDRGWVR